MTIFVGLDWGGSSHAVCVVDAAGKVLDHFAVAHDRDGLADLVARLRRHGPPGETPIAIERPSGLLVDALVDAGFVVTPVHPNVVKACRPRSPWAAKVYHNARKRGCRHPHAVRILASAWLRILWRAWQDGTP